MIQFKTLKYKHYKQAQAIYGDLNNGNSNTVLDDIAIFAVRLVDEWDFSDCDTGEPLTPNEEVIDELSIEQFKELFRAFNAKMGFNVRLQDEDEEPDLAENEAEVPKENAEPLPSG